MLAPIMVGLSLSAGLTAMKTGEIMRLAKWNVFIPVLVLSELVFSTVLIILGPLSYLLVFIAVLVLFAKHEVSPLVRQPAREQRYRRGHWLLAIMNVLVVLALGLPSLLSALLHDESKMMMLWYSMLLYPIAPPVWAIGLVMVLTSRAVPPCAAQLGNPE
ncbi:hypothetical protein [Aquitalea denitrificans]|uniref:hypothetical protein n=1 Tax=Aquitalea denitrificans TaxID=519081 RepID=UPI00135C09A8|nr:hypothetical protein [Aquitalea denitrificans]